MRYDDWDVILFPKDSPVPIQEFKTACYHAQDTKACTPTLTCYISTLPPTTPFRISIHSWATEAKPSAIMEARRKANQKIMYMVQVNVDTARVFCGCFNIASKWPQEIAHEKRSFTSSELPTSQRKPPLAFPPFDPQTLMQPAWNPRGTSGRINIVLSEQLTARSGTLGELDPGMGNEIVCFSFQHAPKDTLEQAGISWPIRNPLYLPGVHGTCHTSLNSTETPPETISARDTSKERHKRSPQTRASTLSFTQSHHHEALQRPRTQPPPRSHFAKSSLGPRDHSYVDIWDDSVGIYEDQDDASPDSWPTQRSMSNSTGEAFMGHRMFAPPNPFRQRPISGNPPRRFQKAAKSSWSGQRPRREHDKQVVLALGDDQLLGQMSKAISPPKRHCDLSHVTENQYGGHNGHPRAPHGCFPAKMGSLSLTGPPSAAALARKSSYSNLHTGSRNVGNKRSPEKNADGSYSKSNATAMYHPCTTSNKENLAPSQSRLPTAFPAANRVPTPDIFASTLTPWDSEVAMRNPSSLFSGYNAYSGGAPVLSEMQSRYGTAHTPSTLGSIKSRKEGLAQGSPSMSEHGVGHDQSLLLALPNGSLNAPRRCMVMEARSTLEDTPSMRPKRAPENVEIIDVDAIDPELGPVTPLDTTKVSPFEPQHKAGMSSVDSTARIERQTRNALGEFLSAPSEVDVGPELAFALGENLVTEALGASPELEGDRTEYEPTAKRKRQAHEGTGSPTSKRGKEDGADMEEVREAMG